MPILRLSPDNTSYWISSGERLEVPSTDASAPTLANEVETTTGISIEEQAIHLSLLGVSKFSIESTGIITVAGTLNYETLVIADDHIPNQKYVDDAITAGAPHTHLEADITDLQAYASIAHTHLEADITDLQAYAPVAHTHLEADITDFAHTHVEADITDLQAYALAADVVKLTGNQKDMSELYNSYIDEIIEKYEKSSSSIVYLSNDSLIELFSRRLSEDGSGR